MAPSVIICTPCCAKRLAAMSRRRPDAIHIAAREWTPASHRGGTDRSVITARDGAVVHLPRLVARIALVFGARPNSYVPNAELIDLVYGDETSGGPNDPIKTLGSYVCQHRHGLALLGVVIRGTGRGWRMDPAEIVPFMQAAE